MKRYFIITVLFLCTVYQLFGQYRQTFTSVDIHQDSQTPLLSTLNLEPVGDSKKSVFFAVVASLIVPGMGELYAGSFESGKYYLIAEGGLWLTYAGFRTHSNWLRGDAQLFASQHAGASFANKDDDYSVNIGNFINTDAYNDLKSRNREYALIYHTDRSPEYLWNWDSDANRMRFKDLRIRSDAAKNNSKFVIGVIVINHLLSAFSAGKNAAEYNKSISENDRVQFQAFTLNTGSRIDGIGLSITTKF